MSNEDSRTGSLATARLGWGWKCAVAWRSLVGALALTGAFSVCSVRLFRLIDRLAVNVIYWDEWDFLNGLFEDRGWWDLFTWQHGPHREGLGYGVIKICAALSSWDTRFEAFVVGGITVSSAVVAVLLKRALHRTWSPFDVCIPLIVLTLAQSEQYACVVNPAHGSVPLLLVLLLTLTTVIERTTLRVALMVTLNFLAVYTGFGVLVGPITVVLFAIQLYGAVEDRRNITSHAIGLLSSLASFGSFFLWHYRFESAAPCFVFPDPHPANYVRFLGLLYLRLFEAQDLVQWRVVLGGLVLAVHAAVLAWAIYGTLTSRGRSRAHVAVFILSGFSLAFGLNAAIGRVCFGPDAAIWSRYVPYGVPVMLGLYLALWSFPLSTPVRVVFLAVLTVLCVVKEVRIKQDMVVFKACASAKQRWRDCYIKVGSIDACDARTHSRLHPNPAVTRLQRKLDFLRAHDLNLFKLGG